MNRRLMASGLLFGLMFCLQLAHAQAAAIDTDADGLSDALEQRLLVQFSPSFLIGAHDCSGTPAEFRAGLSTPLVSEDNGTIYGQVTRVKDSDPKHPGVEIHYYHLWKTDCGRHGHPLDTEHVAVLVRGSGSDVETANWKAAYWYAAAHENTVCDVSQISRAKTLGTEDSGIKIWISPGKHASYLNETLCHAGCGADRCESMTPLTTSSLINLGEPGYPMSGATFVSSPQWPLMAKMTVSNFPADSLARVDQLPDSEIAWATPGKHPVQGVIADSSMVSDALTVSGENTTGALSNANDSTGNALGASYKNTKHALGTSARAVGRALGMKPKEASETKAPE
jgi:hypothetical protein